MTNSDQHRIQAASDLPAACISQSAAKGTAGPVQSTFPSKGLYADEAIEALTDLVRDVVAPAALPPRAAPNTPFLRLTLKSLRIGHNKPTHLRVAA
jgi:hypothetical protein